MTFDNVDVDKAGIGLGFSNTKTIGVSNCNWEVMLGCRLQPVRKMVYSINRFV